MEPSADAVTQQENKPKEPAHISNPELESLIHRAYRHLLELFLLLFLLLAGVEFLLEKALLVVERWKAIVQAYDGGREVKPTPKAGTTCSATEVGNQ
jgi:hypothetical protein